MTLLKLQWRRLGPEVDTGFVPQADASVVAAAVIGPPGRDGRAGSLFVHNQTEPATLWQIAHNLGHPPLVVSAFNGPIALVGDVSHPSANVTEIRFSLAVSGQAYLG